MTKKVRPLGDLLWALAGPITWAAHFFLVYGVEAVICTRSSSPAFAMRWIVVAATVVALGWLAYFVFRQIARRRETPDAAFLHDIGAVLALISMGAIAGAALSGLTLPACAPPAG